MVTGHRGENERSRPEPGHSPPWRAALDALRATLAGGIRSWRTWTSSGGRTSAPSAEGVTCPVRCLRRLLERDQIGLDGSCLLGPLRVVQPVVESPQPVWELARRVPDRLGRGLPQGN